MRLVDLNPHFLIRSAPNVYEHSDDIVMAEGLEMLCPACYWSSMRTNREAVHTILLWGDPQRWHFVGRDYTDLSLMAGRVGVTLTAGACRCRFWIKRGRVDFC